MDEEYTEAIMPVEEVWGIVQCNNCPYWHKMTGYIEPADKRFIKFICPDCNAVELVQNPEHIK